MAMWAAPAVDIATGTALKTILQIATGSAREAQLCELHISSDSTNAAATPLLWRLGRQTSAGTGGTALTPVEFTQEGGTVGSTIQSGPAGTWTTEPTAPSNYVWSLRWSPTIPIILQWPYASRPRIGPSTRLGLVVTAAATCNVTVTAVIEE